MGDTSPPARRLTLDRLGPGAIVEVRALDGFRVGEGPIREPHRHDYHELLWARSGAGEHRIDGEPLRIDPPSVTVIGRGQVHQFQPRRGPRRVGSPSTRGFRPWQCGRGAPTLLL